LCCSEYNATRTPKICCIGATTSSTNSDANNAYVFVNMMMLTEENYIYSNISRQEKCYSASNGPVYHSIHRREVDGAVYITLNKWYVSRFSYVVFKRISILASLQLGHICLFVFKTGLNTHFGGNVSQSRESLRERFKSMNDVNFDSFQRQNLSAHHHQSLYRSHG